MKFNSVGFKRMGQFAAVILICLAVLGCRQWIEMLTNSRNENSTAATSLVSQPDTGASANLLSGDKPSFKFPEVSAEERDYLLSVYRDTWNYIADFVEPSTGLPYDSNKKQPATSVSNIGLYLGSTAIAYRTGLITREEALSRINAAFTSLKKLETWRGFPRVWAAVRSLQPIHGSDTFSYSKHVANLIGGLTLVQTIFPEEYNQAVGSYIRGLDFKDMYDAGTGWIKGGYDLKLQDFAVNQPFGPWHYKYLASESRLISYYLIARGFAPSSHWNSLIRTIQNGDGDWFMVPGLEDGGAYMPYMAGLYVDERDMLIGTSQKNYSHSSMTHAESIGAPVWGWSASLDTRGEYVPYGQLRDEIVAPYASMLAVNYFPKEVVSNLQALEKMGARPETEAKRTTDVWSAFADKRSVFAAPYAFIHKGAVFL
ncbi:MAG: DUF3131 domain-containing protein, partial [Candidatus Omnitrophica bacterium]|nr:DUF3131 domain-containing protein [Candidatus Omnitrophota bacterium]